jgi:hypothetical protein
MKQKKAEFLTESMADVSVLQFRKKPVGVYSFGLHRVGATTFVEIYGDWPSAKRNAQQEARSLGCQSFSVDSFREAN